MIFRRQHIARQSLEALRSIGARDGWLIETADVIRVGFGDAVDHVVLDAGPRRTVEGQRDDARSRVER